MNIYFHMPFKNTLLDFIVWEITCREFTILPSPWRITASANLDDKAPQPWSHIKLSGRGGTGIWIKNDWIRTLVEAASQERLWKLHKDIESKLCPDWHHTECLHTVWCTFVLPTCTSCARVATGAVRTWLIASSLCQPQLSSSPMDSSLDLLYVIYMEVVLKEADTDHFHCF